ncbi:hypothetical protein VTN00DRAFT_4553 [Thermoascus crustaceus]|uniref:uncharacterized protein n=1 Tax=Thermoascus crustaceus TaxID=5088 RepID=UPI003743FBF3
MGLKLLLVSSQIGTMFYRLLAWHHKKLFHQRVLQMKGRAQRKIMHKQMLLFLQLLSGYLQNHQKNHMDHSGETS